MKTPDQQIICFTNILYKVFSHIKSSLYPQCISIMALICPSPSVFCPLYVCFPVSAVCIGTYPGLHQVFLRVQVQNIGVAGCTETFHLSYRKIRPVNRVIINKRCTRTPIFILYNRVYLKDYLYQQKRKLSS